MGKGLPYSMRRASAQVGPAVRKMRINLEDFAVSVSGASGVGFGTAVIGDFPEGNIVFLGAVANLQFFSADADIIATYEGDWSVGTAPTADATLSGAEVDLIPSTSMGAAATAKLSPVSRGTHTVATSGTPYDNTDEALEVNLNVLIDDLSISGVADMTVDGWVEILYATLGDD
jgi:hypothetical protein